MNKDSLDIKNEFDNVIDDLIILDKKEMKFSMNLVNCIFIIMFLFVFASSFMVVKNYYKNVNENKDVKQIVNVKIIDMDGKYE